MNRRPFRAILLLAALFSALALASLASAQTTGTQPGAPKPARLTASAIQIEPVETADVRVPAEFRFAIYERLIERLRRAGTFQKVIRSGDREADGIPDLVTLHMKVEKFREGSETERDLTTVLGATRIDVSTTVTARDGHSLLDQKIQGKVRFRGENLGATNDLAKRIAKLLRQNF